MNPFNFNFENHPDYIALREEFEELFEKDQDALDGIRPSKSNLSAGLLLWAKWHCLARQLLVEQQEKYESPHRSWSHTQIRRLAH